MIDLNRLIKEFTGCYGAMPRVFRAPGRVNIIGEHTDYNDGYVLPCAIDFAAYIAAAPRPDRKINVASLNFDTGFEFDLDESDQTPIRGWAKYVQGAALVLERKGYRLQGADLLIDAEVPAGAGLSSSAALEISAAFALAALSGHRVDRMELAKIGQEAEHEFAGVKTGIMDQFVSVFGEAGHAIFLDCRSFEYTKVPFPSGSFVICNTKIKHDLAEGEYNKRREECESAARFFGKTSLRDVSREDFEARAGQMPETLRKRACHVILENQRVLDAVKALDRNDLPALGRLIDASHESLSGDYEVSCRELDLMVRLARKQPGVLGARMMGGGFGGSTINLVDTLDFERFSAEITEGYRSETGIEPEIYKCEISSGAREINSPL